MPNSIRLFSLLLLLSTTACASPSEVREPQPLSKQEANARQSIAVENAKEFIKALGWEASGVTCMLPDLDTHLSTTCTIGLPDHKIIGAICATDSVYAGSCYKEKED